MLRLADLIIRHRWLTIVTIALLTVFLGWQATKVSLNADFSTYLREDDPMVQQFNRIGELFGGSSTGIALVSGKDVFTQRSLDLIERLTEAFQNVEGIASVTSLTNVVDFRKGDAGLEVGRLIRDSRMAGNPEKRAALRSYVLKNKRYVGKLVSQDGTVAAIILHYAGEGSGRGGDFSTSLRVKTAAENVLKAYGKDAGTSIYFGGMPFMVFNMTTLITENLAYLLPLLLLVLISVLYFSFRHWAGVVFPLLVVIITDVWITGIMSLLNLKFDLLTGIVPIILLALGSADGIHLLKRYFERRQLGNGAGEAARLVFRDMGTPIILTSITTMVGFASLLISNFSVIQQFGLMTALGVLLALVVTLTLLPALLSLGVSPRPAEKRSRFSASGILAASAQTIYTHRRTVLLGTLILIALALTGIPRVYKDVDWTLCLQKGSSPYRAEILLRQKFGGSLPVQILVKGDIRDPAILHFVRKVERKLETVPLVNHAGSIAGILAEMNKVLNGRMVVPESRSSVNNLWFLIENREFLNRMVTPDGRKTLIQARLSTWHTSSLVLAVDSINTYLAGLPQKIAVVDLNLSPPGKRGRLQALRDAEIVRQLSLILREHKLNLSPSVLEQVPRLLMDFRISGPVREQIRADLIAYLQSPEAEAALNPDQISRAARSVAQIEVTTRDADVRRIQDRLQALQVPAEDAQYLAASLEDVLRTTVDGARIRPALTTLLKWLPDSVRKDADLVSELKGALWQANEKNLFLPAEQAKAVLGGGSDAIVREVPWRAVQAGMAPLLNRMEEELTPTQIESLLLTLLFILVLLALIFRSPLGSLIAVVPISITILVNFAVMGYLGIGLDSFTAMIASIAIGLGIDTDIHFISRLRDELKLDGRPSAALQRTFQSTGLSILINAAAVGMGFLVLLAAGGQHIRRFGGLTALTILLSAFLTLTILPALFFWLRPRFLRRAMEEGRRRQRSREGSPEPLPAAEGPEMH